MVVVAWWPAWYKISAALLGQVFVDICSNCIKEPSNKRPSYDSRWCISNKLHVRSFFYEASFEKFSNRVANHDDPTSSDQRCDLGARHMTVRDQELKCKW